MWRRQSCWQPRSTRCWGWICNRRRDKVRFSAMTSLHGKVVFITGAARGIGAQLACRLRDMI